MANGVEHVYPPFFQVKVAGQVVEQTNRRETAHSALRSAGAKPAELWQVNASGSAQLLEHVS